MIQTILYNAFGCYKSLFNQVNRIILITAFFFIICCIQSFGQCSITVDEKLDKYILSAKGEKLYANEDLENGLKTVYGGSNLVVDKIDKDKVKFSLIIIFYTTKHQPVIVPRSIQFIFSNGSILLCQADEYEKTLVNGIKGDICYFRISVSDMEIIRKNSIKTLTISDTRTGESLKMTPFNALFQEQIECILKRYDEL